MSTPSRSSSNALTSAVEAYLASQQATQGTRPEAAEAAAAPPPGNRERTGGSMRSAYEEVLRHEARKLESGGVPRRSMWQRLRGPLALVLLLGTSAYVWFGRPEFLLQPPHTALPRPRSQLTASRQLVAVALEVEDFRRTTGRLPESLKELGLAISHISYTMLPDSRFELRTGTGPHVLVYHGAPGGEAEVREEVHP